MYRYKLQMKWDYERKRKNKVKLPLLIDRGGLYGCQTSRIPHCLDNQLTDGVEVVRFMPRKRFTPQEDS
jgi:hypothetical protein